MVSNPIHLFIYMIVIRRLGLKCLIVERVDVSPAVVASTFENKQELFVLGGYGAETSVEICELLYISVCISD